MDFTSRFCPQKEAFVFRLNRSVRGKERFYSRQRRLSMGFGKNIFRGGESYLAGAITRRLPRTGLIGGLPPAGVRPDVPLRLVSWD